MSTLENAIQKTLNIANVKGEISVTPKTISIYISNKADADKIFNAFNAAKMAPELDDMNELGIGDGFCVSMYI